MRLHRHCLLGDGREGAALVCIFVLSDFALMWALQLMCQL